MTDNIDIVEFAAEFIGVESSNLPDDPYLLQRALISEAIRLAVSNASHSDDGWRRIHINRLKHWVKGKLGTVLDEFDELFEVEEDWFLDILRESQGPNLTFLGDVIELTEGYYTLAPTRVVKGGETKTILISGLPTSAFASTPLEVTVEGVTRIIQNTDPDVFEDLDIPVQSPDSYIGLGDEQVFNRDFILDMIETQSTQPWTPQEGWEGYQGRSRGFRFNFRGDDVEEVSTEKGRISLWKSDEGHGGYEYWLRINPDGKPAEQEMLRVPRKLHKQVCLILDHIADKTRTAEFTRMEDGVRISCGFSPPSTHFRWLYAIGASSPKFPDGKIQWMFDPSYYQSSVEIFDKLAISVVENERRG